MSATAGNLLTGLPCPPAAEEAFAELMRHPGVRIERIVSTGQCSPPDFWYDQPEGEWVVVLRGAARLWLEGRDAEVVLNPGDHCLIPAGTAHRVTFTSPDEPTVWLAIHSDPA